MAERETGDREREKEETRSSFFISLDLWSFHKIQKLNQG
jgi:hypothetical protein